MVKTIAIVIVALVAALLVYAATKPDTFRVQRSTTIQAPPERIFALINDFHSWRSWSPYETLDPAMKRTFTGAASDRGAVYEWESNGKAGVGRMEITESIPPSSIMIKLDFIKPFEAHNIAEFTLAPNGGATTVTWAMHGPLPYVAKVAHAILNIDRMVGRDFEAGLATLKAAAEK